MSKLKKLMEDLDKDVSISNFSSLFESNETSVDWDFSKVTIIKSSLGKKPPKPPTPPDGGGDPPPPPNPDDPTEVDIDQPDNDDDGDCDSGSCKKPNIDAPDIKIGAIVQDHKTGKKGRIINIDGSKVEIEPMSDSELEAEGFKKLMKAPNAIVKQRSIIDPKYLERINWGDL